MNNDDFKRLIAQGSSGSRRDEKRGSEKLRFDKDDIARMETQIRNSRKKTGSKFASKKPNAEKNDDETSKDKEQRYRNRADERRRDANPDYDPSFEQMAQLDIEKSKFLGGDEKHTHLVKGLDYALLGKKRMEIDEEQRKKAQALSTEDQTDYAPTTVQGQGIKSVLFDSKNHGLAPLNFSRVQFEFDLDPLSTQQLPTITMRSRAEDDDDEQLINGTMDIKLAQRVAEAVQNKAKVAKQKRNRLGADPVAESAKFAPPVIFDDVPAYVPPDVVASPQITVTDQPTKGSYFSSLRVLTASEEAKQREAEEAHKGPALPQHSDEGLTEEQKLQVKAYLKPFQTAARQSARQAAGPDGELDLIDDSEIKVSVQGELDGPKKKKGKWARKGKGQGPSGDAMGVFGEYSGIYPETAEFAYAYESDGEGGQKKKAKTSTSSTAPSAEAPSTHPEDF